MSFSERVKLLKKEKGITNEALAEATGIPLGTLGKLLSGYTEEPKLSTAVAIADALGCSLEYLATGKPEELRLNESETMLITRYRALDAHGVRVCDYIIGEEYMRSCESARNVVAEVPADIFRQNAKRRSPKKQSEEVAAVMRRIPLFADRVSAGLGMHLDSNDTTEISIVDSPKTRNADFALRVSGDSMEPRFSDGDILLVSNSAEVGVGELGIFICDGEGYFKQFGGDRLVSLNPRYAPIPLSSFGSFSCRGKVLGTLRHKH